MSRLAWPLLVLGALAGWAAVARAEDEHVGLQDQLATAKWTEVAPGIEQLNVPDPLAGSFAAYRLAQDKVTARVLAPLKPSGSTAEEVMAASKALLVVNGGFFWIKPSGALAPTGLLVVDGVKLAGMKKCRACSAVLYTDVKGLHIGRPVELSGKRGILSALQTGPMLVEAGKAQDYKADGPAAARTAVCTTGQSIIVVASVQPMTLYDLAALMASAPGEGGFGCQEAINLDGGPSTQLASGPPYAGQSLGFPIAVGVQNFVAFFQR